jgi:hypothetical protein
VFTARAHEGPWLIATGPDEVWVCGKEDGTILRGKPGYSWQYKGIGERRLVSLASHIARRRRLALHGQPLLNSEKEHVGQMSRLIWPFT